MVFLSVGTHGFSCGWLRFSFRVWISFLLVGLIVWFSFTFAPFDFPLSFIFWFSFTSASFDFPLSIIFWFSFTFLPPLMFLFLSYFDFLSLLSPLICLFLKFCHLFELFCPFDVALPLIFWFSGTSIEHRKHMYCFGDLQEGQQRRDPGNHQPVRKRSEIHLRHAQPIRSNGSTMVLQFASSPMSTWYRTSTICTHVSNHKLSTG